jgi:AmiR/NasT family two-component response regulator
MASDDRTVLSDHDKARNLLDAEFGLGEQAAHEKLRTDATARRIYDCAIQVIARSIKRAREDAQ